MGTVAVVMSCFSLLNASSCISNQLKDTSLEEVSEWLNCDIQVFADGDR